MSTLEFYDLIQPGMTLELGSHTFEADEIVRFAQRYDPQRFHLTEEGARESHFGRLCASGWHTLSVWMRKNVENSPAAFEKLTGFGDPYSLLGPSPGIRNIRWTAPVYVGDTITFSSTMKQKSLSEKRPGWGLVSSQSKGVNQDGVIVFTMEGAINIRTKRQAA